MFFLPMTFKLGNSSFSSVIPASKLNTIQVTTLNYMGAVVYLFIESNKLEEHERKLRKQSYLKDMSEESCIEKHPVGGHMPNLFVILKRSIRILHPPIFCLFTKAFLGQMKACKTVAGVKIYT